MNRSSNAPETAEMPAGATTAMGPAERGASGDSSEVKGAADIHGREGAENHSARTGTNSTEVVPATRQRLTPEQRKFIAAKTLREACRVSEDGSDAMGEAIGVDSSIVRKMWSTTDPAKGGMVRFEEILAMEPIAQGVFLRVLSDQIRNGPRRHLSSQQHALIIEKIAGRICEDVMENDPAKLAVDLAKEEQATRNAQNDLPPTLSVVKGGES